VALDKVRVNTHSQAWLGHGKGQADDVSTSLPVGSYVIDAHSVSALGDGSTNAGMKVLKNFEHDVLKKFGKKIDLDEGVDSEYLKALTSDGEYQLMPLTVTLLGHGNNTQGSHYLDMMIKNLRAHKRSNGLGLPPKAKNIWDYLPPSARRGKV
jgi:hypothetical protein